jgi:MFS family permease
MPTFRRVFGLSLVRVGLLSQLLTWASVVVEPPAAGLIDLRSRRPLMAGGALAIGGAMLVMAGATGFGVLALGLGLFGLGSGPLALTADVVVVEAYPTSPDRAFSRATFFDTVGALLGPGFVALAGAAGVSWRVVLAALGGCTLAYAVAIAGTEFPAPARALKRGQGVARQLAANARAVVLDATTRRFLLVLFCFDVFEAAFVLKFVWLHEEVGLSQPLVAAYAAGEQLVDLVALLLLDRWLTTRDPHRVLRSAAAALVVLPALWVAAPGVGGRIVVGVPLAFAHALIWPMAKARSLTAVPELAGATQAITALFPIVPLAVLEAWFAQAVGLGAAIAVTAAIGSGLLLLAERGGIRPWSARRGPSRQPPAHL